MAPVKLPAVLSGALAVMLAVAGPAAARTPCGHHGSRDACLIRGNRTIHGSLPKSQAFLNRWYRIRVRARTHLSLAIDDREDPDCSSSGTVACGSVQVTLLSPRGDQLRESRTSTPSNGVNHPVTISRFVHKAGTYYADVGGYTNGEPMPFTLRAHGKPRLRR